MDGDPVRATQVREGSGMRRRSSGSLWVSLTGPWRATAAPSGTVAVVRPVPACATYSGGALPPVGRTTQVDMSTPG